jgi:hypothetical protein
VRQPKKELRRQLVGPAAEIGGGDGRTNVISVFIANIASGGVVADSVLVQLRKLAIDHHSITAIEWDAADAGRIFPDQLCQMTNLVKNIIREVGLAIMSHHGSKLALVPALCNGGSDVENCARNGEEVLAFEDAIRNVVLESATLGGNASVGLAIIAPCQRPSTVVSASGIMMI